MKTEVFREKMTGFARSSYVKIVGLAAAGSGLVASASATTDINASVGPKSFAL